MPEEAYLAGITLCARAGGIKQEESRYKPAGDGYNAKYKDVPDDLLSLSGLIPRHVEHATGRGFTRAEVIKREQRYKQKLGTRATGLNC